MLVCLLGHHCGRRIALVVCQDFILDPGRLREMCLSHYASVVCVKLLWMLDRFLAHTGRFVF